MIVESRIDELLEYVDKEFARVHRSHKLPGGVVFVGGSAVIPGLAEFARERLQLPARIGSIKGLEGLIDTVNHPSFATATGLMMLDILLAPYNGAVADESKLLSGSFASSIKKLFGRFKDTD